MILNRFGYEVYGVVRAGRRTQAASNAPVVVDLGNAIVVHLQGIDLTLFNAFFTTRTLFGVDHSQVIRCHQFGRVDCPSHGAKETAAAFAAISNHKGSGNGLSLRNQAGLLALLYDLHGIINKNSAPHLVVKVVLGHGPDHDAGFHDGIAGSVELFFL